MTKSPSCRRYLKGTVAALLLLVSACSTSNHADLVLYNGTIWTVDVGNPTADAVAIRDGKFVAVGRRAEVQKWQGADTRTIDLGGKFVLPGFNDNHVHFASAARFLEFNIMKASTQEEFVARVQRVLQTLRPGEWILGGLWGAYDQWASGSAGGQSRTAFAPDMLRIEALTADNPMFIRKFDDTEFAVNQTALHQLGLDPSNPSEFPGIVFVRNREHEFSGILRGEGVLPFVTPKLPATFSHQRRLSQTRNALAEIRKYGVTNISDMSDDEQLDIYRELRASGELTVRVHFRHFLDRWQELADQGIKVGSGDAWIRLGSLKGHIDGIMGNSTARFFEPYDNQPGNRGKWRKLMVDEAGEFVEGKFLGYMLGADKAGLQLTVHAIGDEANHLLMNYLEELEKQNGKRDRRFRLVHAQVLAPEDFHRLGELGIVAEVQPFHLSDDMRWMEERIGHERCRGAYAFKKIVDNGGTLCFGTDWPGTAAAEYPINPMFGLYAATTRQTVIGQPAGGWFPEERISMADAIKAYTLNTAYANFEENIKGSIEVGKVADLAVLSNNLLESQPEDILKTEVLYTIVGGKVVYQRE